MSNELTYKITFKLGEVKYYQILGPNGELFHFYKKRWEKCRLISSGNTDYIKIITTGILFLGVSLDFKFFSKLSNIKFYSRALSGYNVTGNYLTSQNNINWTWKASGAWSTSLILVDNYAGDQAMAKIESFTLDNARSGTLTIASGVPQDFCDTILTTACLVWKIEQEKKIDCLINFRISNIFN